MNVRVDRIARRQASMGGFAPEATPSPPSPVASEFEDDDDDDDNLNRIIMIVFNCTRVYA